VRAQHDANRRALADALEQERATLQRARAELAGASEQRDKLAKVLPMYREQEAAYRDLQRQGFAGRLMQMDKERELIEKERDLAGAGHTIAAAQATITQSERRLAQIESGWRQRLQVERIEALGQVARLEQELAKSDHRGRQLELRASHDGVVQDLATHTRGTVVQPGTVLMNLVPDTEPLLAEVWLRNADIGFVAPGQPVRLKLAAYAFQKYGLLEGRIAQVSADASDPVARGAAGPAARDSAAADAADSGPVFKVQVSLDSQQLLGRGEPMRLAPGMAVTAEIHQGTRSVLEYLLSPIQRVAQEAGRER
jgi:hemolysin D